MGVISDMPRLVNLLSPARILPVRWFDKLRNQLGVNNTMDHFVGHSDAHHSSPVADIGLGTAKQTEKATG